MLRLVLVGCLCVPLHLSYFVCLKVGANTKIPLVGVAFFLLVLGDFCLFFVGAISLLVLGE